jgi:hypothetical protein
MQLLLKMFLVLRKVKFVSVNRVIGILVNLTFYFINIFVYKPYFDLSALKFCKTSDEVSASLYNRVIPILPSNH